MVIVFNLGMLRKAPPRSAVWTRAKTAMRLTMLALVAQKKARLKDF
jgi:hypothetical protein